jgi:hypothetical protein
MQCSPDSALDADEVQCSHTAAVQTWPRATGRITGQVKQGVPASLSTCPPSMALPTFCAVPVPCPGGRLMCCPMSQDEDGRATAASVI